MDNTVTLKEKIQKAADDYAFQVPFDGTKDFYNLKELKAFEAGAQFVLKEFAREEQKPEAKEQMIDEKIKELLDNSNADLAPINYVNNDAYCWLRGYEDGLQAALKAIKEQLQPQQEAYSIIHEEVMKARVGVKKLLIGKAPAYHMVDDWIADLTEKIYKALSEADKGEPQKPK